VSSRTSLLTLHAGLELEGRAVCCAGQGLRACYTTGSLLPSPALLQAVRGAGRRGAVRERTRPGSSSSAPQAGSRGRRSGKWGQLACWAVLARSYALIAANS
jgi:hypothetical protein